MLLGYLVLAQILDPVPLDLDLRPPRSEEVQAAERLSRKRVPAIVRVCRKAIHSGDVERYVRAFADRSGLSSYGRVTLEMNCRIYEQGMVDGRSKR
jgi:hypothetical protein